CAVRPDAPGTATRTAPPGSRPRQVPEPALRPLHSLTAPAPVTSTESEFPRPAKRSIMVHPHGSHASRAQGGAPTIDSGRRRHPVASAPGHLTDQLCQSIDNPSEWLITSEWESAPPFLAWVNSEEHVELVQPLHDCVSRTRSLRFSVLRETSSDPANAPETAKGQLQVAPRVGD